VRARLQTRCVDVNYLVATVRSYPENALARGLRFA
jgi:hypothetical protein